MSVFRAAVLRAIVVSSWLWLPSCSAGTRSDLAADASSPDTVAVAHEQSPTAGAVPMPASHPDGIVVRRVGGEEPEHEALARARKLLAIHASLADRLDERSDGLTLTSEGFVTSAWRSPSGQSDKIGAVLPHLANDVLRVSPARAERWAIALEPRGAAPVPGRLDAGRVVYADAMPHADVVIAARERWIEELVLLRDEQAPT